MRVCCFHCKQQICSGLNQMQIIQGWGSCTDANPNQMRQKMVIFLWDPSTGPSCLGASNGSRHPLTPKPKSGIEQLCFSSASFNPIAGEGPQAGPTFLLENILLCFDFVLIPLNVC